MSATYELDTVSPFSRSSRLDGYAATIEPWETLLVAPTGQVLPRWRRNTRAPSEDGSGGKKSEMGEGERTDREEKKKNLREPWGVQHGPQLPCRAAGGVIARTTARRVAGMWADDRQPRTSSFCRTKTGPTTRVSDCRILAGFIRLMGFLW